MGSAFLIVACLALEVALLVGLVRRARVRQCYTLPLLVLAWFATSTALIWRPDWNTWDFWIIKELAHAALALVLALELVVRVFRPLPAPWLWARLVLGGASVLALALVASLPAGPVSVRILPSLLLALAWLYTGLGCILLQYGMPVEPLHRAILWGLSPYLMVYAATWGHVDSEPLLPNALNPPMFTAALAVLVWSACRPEGTPPDADPITVGWLWPWRLKG